MENLKAVALSAWVYVYPTSHDVKGSFVFTVSNEVGVNVCWRGLTVMDPEVPRGKWFKISGFFDLTSFEFKPGYKIQIYFWNTSSTDILIDDYFISLGGPVERRGDSARVDMTKPAGYTEKFNYPPFRVALLEKESVSQGINPSDINPEDLVVAGDFLGSSHDDVISIRKDGKASVWAFCAEKEEFRKLTLANPAVIASIAPISDLQKGRFMPGKPEQFVVSGEKGWVLCSLDPSGDPCAKSTPQQYSIRVLSRSGDHPSSLLAGDFTGDQRSAILFVDANGNWKLQRFEPADKAGGTWKIIANGDHSPVAEWNRENYETGLSAGRFLSSQNCDLVLAVTKKKSDGKYSYTLLRLNGGKSGWEPLYREKQHRAGLTIGTDTLKPGDRFLLLPVLGSNPVVLRYNRDWRYDLKEIRFNDTTFAIRSSVDFHGFEKSCNPKYYESLRLVPGSFLSPGSGSLLVAGKVARDRQYQTVLPDFIQIYSFPAHQ